jgi:hypothetical protein
MVDNGENILVEYDYDNITVIDPNKVIDELGNVKERFVKQEDLVFYVNLECNVLPRTKLAVGTAANDQIRTISVGKINFLNPGFKTFLDNSYTDQITGKGALQGLGVNQPKLNSVTNPNKEGDYYITQETYSNGKFGSVDTGLLGLIDVNVSIGLDYLPVIDVTLEDVQGRALFESGDNSPYAAFFQLPYPQFILTMKGYYGKAVKYPIMLQSFTSTYQPASGNFVIKLKFYGYKYTLLSYLNWNSLLAVPHMYNSSVSTVKFNTTDGINNVANITKKTVSRGYQKIREMYSEYKSKGLIADDFPEITIKQLKTRLDLFITDILNSFSKQNFAILTEIDNYTTVVYEYNQKVLQLRLDSWFNKYMDTTNYFILKNTGIKVYQFKTELNTEVLRTEALTLLEGLITEYNKKLSDNPALGKNGKIEINVNNVQKTVPVDISLQTFKYPIDVDDIDFEKSYLERNPTVKTSSGPVYDKFVTDSKTTFFNSTTTNEVVFYFFEGKNSFSDKIETIQKTVTEIRNYVEESMTKAITSKLNDKNSKLGFKPSIRNILAVFYAQGEAFIRLLDDVHIKAWGLNQNKYRKQLIFSNSTAQSVDVKDSTQNDTPIYPWPQVIKETIGEDKQEKFELIYPGDSSVSTTAKAFSPEVWPEVEFVEEWIKGYTTRDEELPDVGPLSDSLGRPNRVTLNGIEFPVSNQILQNKEEVKFFYEIYERLYLNSFYSKLSRISGYDSGVYTVESECEKVNIINSLGDDNPFLTKTLREYQLNQTNYLPFLRHISNTGEGESWQKYIRGEFVTPYIQNFVEIPYALLNNDVISSQTSQPDVSLIDKTETNITDYIQNQSSSNTFDFSDMYPITNLFWDKNYLANGKTVLLSENAYETKNTLKYNPTLKTITNFLNDYDFNKCRPISNFNYKNNVFSQELSLTDFTSFYKNRKLEDQFITEGNLNYVNYSGSVSSNQTTSMFNTPYFINAIQKGVYNFRYNTLNLYPFKSAAFLFLNSLPLTTLREKYKNFDNTNNSTTELDYLISTFKKFGAVHKLPYAWVLKYGSIWHRYKTWNQTGVDFLDEVWTDFDYKSGYNPFEPSGVTKTFTVNINNTPTDIVLQENIVDLVKTNTIINTGFYPQVIDDFNTFFQGTRLFSGTTQLIGKGKVSGTTFTVTQINSNELLPGSIISLSGITTGFTILNQISGTTNGIGDYNIDTNLSPITERTFYVTNLTIDPYQNSNLQGLIDTGGMILTNSQNTKILLGSGFDPNDPLRTLKLTPWTVLAKKSESEYYVLPSFGSNYSQLSKEIFKDGQIKFDVIDNKSLYNGSVRLFWAAPNYGFFDNEKVIKSSPDSYFKEIFSGQSTQQNFLIDGDITKYTKISEIFTTLEKGVLDLFEEEFLNFSRSIYDYKQTIPPTLSTETETEKINKNFQQLMRKMFVVSKPNGTTGELIVSEVITNQKLTFESYFKQFMEYDVIFKLGNPTMFNRRLFYTFSNKYFVDPISYQGYNQSAQGFLPSSGGTITLSQSKSIYPETWKDLELYVGFSEIPELQYKDSGSYITDFFIDMNVQFNSKNIIDFAPIIKLYATQKLKDPTLNFVKFYNLMNTYLDGSEKYVNDTLEVLMTSVRKDLPGVVSVTIDDQSKFKEYQGEQTRFELWELFKTLNDTWIAGGDFKTKTLFEDVMLVDRASRDIGDEILIDIFKIKYLIESDIGKSNLLDVVSTILTDNNFIHFMLPSYVNFYNVQDVVKNPTPRTEGTLEFANSLFGTFLNVDYRKSSPKFLCMYASKPSEHLDMKENIDYRFRNDAFDLRRASDNPLVENLTNKTDWATSNKVVGFNVDVGPQNQQIFKEFSVSQDPGKPTSESIAATDNMANQYQNRSTSTQSNSLYNLYKNRSYSCSVEMMGNALIQPMMYFNLRYVPMFSGPYMITKVLHRINENGFDTSFEGIRQPFYSIPKIDNFIQSLTKEIITKIKEEIKSGYNKSKLDPNNVLFQKNNVLGNLGTTETLTTNQDCSDKLLAQYGLYTNLTTPVLTTATFKDVYDKIITKLEALKFKDDTTNNLFYLENGASFIFSAMYTDSGNSSGFEAYENNYSTINLTEVYGGDLVSFMTTKYFCVTRGNTQTTNVPVGQFETLDKFLDFFVAKFKDKIVLLTKEINTNTATPVLETLTKYYVLEWPIKQNDDVYKLLTEDDKKKIQDRFKEGLTKFQELYKK